ncbi:hypothetical protein [Methylobacterium sp. Leaf399]|uniref:hypothetical protein n=1 Tax=Methylobacterium sp. Leaf399 TaxID=1736364 RepID=UPI000A847DB6|nr:hypothetical protein [Methylobacterium sp. Leaf399]
MSNRNRSPLSSHATRRAQQRGKRRDALELVYHAGDHERRAGRSRRAVSLSHRACRSLREAGVPPHLIDRARRVELVLSNLDDAVVTVLTIKGERQ